MANYKTIRDYLVGLGFSVDQVSERKFQDALKRTGVAVEKFTKASAEGFAVVGGAFVAATAAVAGATIGLMRSTAQQDLGFQVFARRMMMGTDAAKKMKIATDALGYSLEEIIWGPPELAERYQQLIKDQTRMMELLGGDKGESAFRKIRDIGFEFTRMGTEVQYFGMRLTEDVINKLAGSPESLEQRLKDLNNWFVNGGFVKMSDQISSTLVPAIKWAATETMAFFTDVKQFFGWLESKNKVSSLLGQNSTTQMLDRQLSGDTPSDDEKHQYWKGIWGKITGKNWRQIILDDAAKLGIPGELALAIAQKESGMNPKAPVGSSGEIGMFQLMPDTIKSLQKQHLMGDPNDPEQNILGGLNWLLQKKGGGDWATGIERYNGKGPKARAYRDDVMRRWQGMPTALPPVGTYNPSSYHPDSGSITINVASAHATPEQIKHAVHEACDERDRRAMRQRYARVQGAYV